MAPVYAESVLLEVGEVLVIVKVVQGLQVEILQCRNSNYLI
jgi:hypothetical protein